jgi:hypothetical protein
MAKKFSIINRILLLHPKILTQNSDVALTAEAAVHTDVEYGVFFVLSLGLPGTCREKKEHCYICLCICKGQAEMKTVWL